MKIDETSVMSESISSVTEAVLVRGGGDPDPMRHQSLSATAP